MAVKSIAGLPYLSPTQADGASGTLLAGILEDQVEFEDGLTDRAFGSGLEADAWTSVATPGRRPAIYLPVQDVSAETNKLLWMLRSTGTGIDSAGGNGVGLHASPPGYSLVIRPRSSGETTYWYFPRVSIDAERSVVRVSWSRNGRRFNGSALVLYPRRSLDGSKKAWMEGTYTAINTYYGLPA